MFNVSNCPKCDGHMFKVVTQEPTDSRYKLNFVQCSTCNVPIGVLNFLNTAAQLEEQKESITKISSRLSSIENTLNQIAYVLNQRR